MLSYSSLLDFSNVAVAISHLFNLLLMKKTLILTVCLSLFFCVQAQVALDSLHHAYRAGDAIIKQPVSYPLPGIRGEGLTWDFSRLPAAGNDYLLQYFYRHPGDTLTVGREHDTRYLYRVSEEGIRLHGYANRRVEMSFEDSEPILPFPLHYGDTLSSPFSGSGRYFSEHPLTASGRTAIAADATGRLITPGKDTLDHTLRVSRIRYYDDIGSPEGVMRLETYSWYAPGYRYPIMEGIRSLVIRYGEEKESFALGFYFPPAGIEALSDDPHNTAVRDSLNSGRGIILSCAIHPNPVDTECLLRFELSEAATVRILLSDMMGNTLQTVESSIRLEAGVHEKRIPVYALTRGHYALSVHADGSLRNVVLIKQ